jgi:hypothetical protein
MRERQSVVAIDHRFALGRRCVRARALKIVLQHQLADLGVQVFAVGDIVLGRFAALEDFAGALQQLRLPVRNRVRFRSKRLARSEIVWSPLIAAKATFALKAAV